MLVDLRPGRPPGHLSPPTLTGSGGGVRAAAAMGDDDRTSPEGESASAPPDCSDPGPFILCRFAEPCPPKRTLSSPLKMRREMRYLSVPSLEIQAMNRTLKYSVV